MKAMQPDSSPDGLHAAHPRNQNLRASRGITTDLRYALAAIIYLLALGIAGTDDYAEAVRHEQIICERNPALTYCPNKGEKR